MEQEITNNTSVYSSWLSDVGGLITLGGGMRGTHGTSMKDICIAASSPAAQYDPQGQSNIVNPDSNQALCSNWQDSQEPLLRILILRVMLLMATLGLPVVMRTIMHG